MSQGIITPNFVANNTLLLVSMTFFYSNKTVFNVVIVAFFVELISENKEIFHLFVSYSRSIRSCDAQAVRNAWAVGNTKASV